MDDEDSSEIGSEDGSVSYYSSTEEEEEEDSEMIEEWSREDCVTECVRSIYKFLYENCFELHKKTFGEVSQNNDSEAEEENGQSFTLLCKLIDLMSVVLNGDNNRDYNNPFVLGISELTTATIWNLFTVDLEYILEEHKQHHMYNLDDYIGLNVEVNWFYNTYVKKIASNNHNAPRHFAWFEPFVLQWLNESEDVSLEYVHSIFARDKDDDFQKHSDTLFSISAVDVCNKLRECFDVSKFQISDRQLCTRYMEYSANTFKKVVIAYVIFVKKEFPSYLKELRILTQICNSFGEVAILFLGELVRYVSDALDLLVAILVSSQDFQFSINVQAVVMSVRKVANQQSIKAKEILEPVLNPLCDFLPLCLAYATNEVFFRISSKIFKTVLKLLEIEVLQPRRDKSVKSLKRKISHAFRNVTRSNIRTTEVHQLQSQNTECTALGVLIEYIIQFFYNRGTGLEIQYMENFRELKSLRHTLTLLVHTTSSLAYLFVKVRGKSEGRGPSSDPISGDLPVYTDCTDKFNIDDGSVGEVSLKLDLFTSRRGEHKIFVKVIAAHNLEWSTESDVFCPFVEVNLVGPKLRNIKHKVATRSKINDWSPKYNERFQFTVNTMEKLNTYELHICVKDYCFGKGDRLVGVAGLHLEDILELNSCTCLLTLAKGIKLDRPHSKIYHILSLRTYDKYACELVKLIQSEHSQPIMQFQQYWG